MRAAGLAAKRGYTDVYAFIGGIPEWRKFNYPMNIDPGYQKISVTKLPPQAFHAMIQKGSYYILDVRPLNFERETAFIRGAHLCPLVYLADRYTEIARDKKIILTDWAMKQSPSAAKFLITKGYRVEGVLQGGMERWKAENLPFETRAPSGQIEPLSNHE